MSRPTILASKFVGTISLGLLTGSSLTLSSLILPPLLSLPTLPPALASFTTLRRSTASYQTALASLAASSFLLAYALSPRNVKHPYMLWTTATLLASWAIGWWRQDAEKELTLEEGRSASWAKARAESGEVNGEVVREEMEGWRWGQVLRGGLWAVGWGMSVVGIWGDGA
ncbi:hypothetical protein MMC34_008141 [Xylographa carneopallida]|nr:hypothetical protein [Xylographa carneopallida]